MWRTDNLGANGGGYAPQLDAALAVVAPRPRMPLSAWLALVGSFVFLHTGAVDESSTDDMALRDIVAQPLAPTANVDAPQQAEQARAYPPAAHDPEFDAFFTRLEQPLYGYLRRMVPSDEVAMELAQEAFFRAWKHFAELSTYERPDAWLYRVATNLAISHLRRRKAVSFTHLFSRASEIEGADATEEALPFADPNDLEGCFVERDAIARVLQHMPERQRAALLLRAVQGFSCEEIATTLGITVTNARQTLSRARERFRRLYEAAQREA